MRMKPFVYILFLVVVVSCSLPWENDCNTTVSFSVINDTNHPLIVKQDDYAGVTLNPQKICYLKQEVYRVSLPTPLFKPDEYDNSSFRYDPGLGKTFAISKESGDTLVVWHQDRVNDEPYSIYDSKNWEVTSPYEKYSNMKDYPTIEWTFHITPEMLGLKK